jgi:S-formylglutathione hydrolase FrmB
VIGGHDGVTAEVVAPVRASHCQVDTWEEHSGALGCVKRASVLVPPGFDGTADAAVLYLLHGFGASRETWLRRTRLPEYVAGLNLLVVLPESGRRWFINDHRGFRYEDHLLGELLPSVEARYLGKVGVERRGIGGFSMGGAAALMQALRHPDTFSVVVSHAGAFEAPQREGDPYADLRGARDFAMPSVETHERVWGPVGSDVRRRYELSGLLASVPPGPRPSVYADVGIDDYPRVIDMNRRAANTLQRAGMEIAFHERPGAHDLAYLDASLPSSLRFAAQRFGQSSNEQEGGIS